MSFTPDTTLPCTVLEAANYTSQQVSKCYICLHSIESPPGKSWAEALAGPSYFQNPATKASVHYLADADSIVQTAPEDRWTWSTGSPGSKRGIHIEQAGYAAFTRTQWLGLPEAIGSSYIRPNGKTVTFTAQDAADMASQFVVVASLIADICRRHGWDPIAATQPDLVREVNGENLGRHVRHRDITQWVGGTTHTDPGPDYPWLELLAAVQQRLSPSTPSTPTSPTPDEEFTVSQYEDIIARLDRIEAQQKRDREYMNELPKRVDDIDTANQQAINGVRTILDRIVKKLGA